jgi:hypothetical protein
MAALINENTSMSLYAAGCLILGVVGFFTYLEPTQAQAELNKSKNETQDLQIQSLQTDQRIYNDHILNISNALSEIKGQVKAMEKR